MSVKRRVWEIVEAAKPGDRISRAFDIGILSLIGLNVVAVMLETVGGVSERYGGPLPALSKADKRRRTGTEDGAKQI